MRKQRGKSNWKSKVSDAFGGFFVKVGLISERSRFRGFWGHRLYAPISISDPAHLLTLDLDLTRGDVQLLNQISAITDKSFRRIVHYLYGRGDKLALRTLGRLAFGGGLKWEENYENLVVNEGLDDILDVYLSSGVQDTTWFVGLLAASPSPAAGWTAASLAAVDFVAYSEATLPAWTDGGVASQSVDNSGSPASFSINADTSTIGGAFLIGTNAKATPAGTLYAAGAFTGGNKAADNGDTLDVTATFTSADDGV